MDTSIQDIAQAAGKPDAVKVSKDMPGVIWIMAGCLVVLCGLSAAVIAALTWARWPDDVAAQRIQALGTVAFMSTLGTLLWVAAMASPYLGRFQAHAGPIELDVAGKDPAA